MIYLPPPAQAQAQPAQAQAHAQLLPPLPPLLFEPLDEDFGIGLVVLVTPDVKVLTLPSTLLEKFCTPVMTEAAKVEPGTLVVERPVGKEAGTPLEVLGRLEDGW